MKKLLVGAVLCFALSALPAIASDDGEEGFFLGIEATSLKPSGGMKDYALVDPDFADSAPQGTIRSVEHDYEINPRVTLGWANSNGGWWGLTWWEHDEDALDTVSAATPANLWDILYFADDAIEDYEGTASALSNVDASIIDITYSRPLTSSDKFSTRWNVGLRSAELGNALSVLYDDTFSLETVRLTSDTDGFGFTGGLTGTFKLSDTWMLSGGTSYSLLTGDTETSTYMDESGFIDADIRSESDTTFSILEARCSVVWHGPDWLYLWLGWEMAQWNNVVETNLFPDDVNEGFIQNDIGDMAWDGWTFGAGFTF